MASKRIPLASASTTKPATSSIEILLEIVMVRRSLVAANAMSAGNNTSFATSSHIEVVLAPIAPRRDASARSVDAWFRARKARRAPAATGAFRAGIRSRLLAGVAELSRHVCDRGLEVPAERVDDGDD